MAESGSVAEIDWSRVPRGQVGASALVQAVFARGDYAERHCLEIKGPLDFTKKNAMAKVAKFILGASNRPAALADKAFEGYAIMVVGVSAAGIAGVPPVEILEIEKGVRPFLGAEGPAWDLLDVPVLGSANRVLVIVVEPPPAGADPFICHADGDEKLVDGRIYTRSQGETREAKGDELKLLLQRGKVAPKPPVKVEVGIVGEVNRVFVDEAQTLEPYIASVRSEWIDALPKPTTTASFPTGLPGSVLSESLSRAYTKNIEALNPLFRQDSEPRTEEQYRAELDEWERECRAAWPSAVLRIASYLLPPNEISIANGARGHLRGVELDLHLDGNVQRITKRIPPDDLQDMATDLPEPPRKWGPVVRDVLGLSSLGALSLSRPMLNAPVFPVPSATWKNTGSVSVHVDAGDIRPEETFQTEDEKAILIVPGDAPAMYQGTWRMTVDNYDDVYTGDLVAPVSQPRNLTRHIRRFLRLT